MTKFFVLPPGLLLFFFMPFMLFALATISGLDNIIIEAEEARVINSWRLPTAGSRVVEGRDKGRCKRGTGMLLAR